MVKAKQKTKRNLPQLVQIQSLSETKYRYYSKVEFGCLSLGSAGLVRKIFDCGVLKLINPKAELLEKITPLCCQITLLGSKRSKAAPRARIIRGHSTGYADGVQLEFMVLLI